MAAFLIKTNRTHVARTLYSTLAAPAAEKPSSVNPFRKVKASIRYASDPEKLAEIFRESSALSCFSKDRALFDLSVKKLCGFQRLDLIEQILEHPKESTVMKSEGFWIRIMMLYSKAGMVEQAVKVFNQMETLGCKRTRKSFCALLSVYLENRQFDQVFESFISVPSKMGLSQCTVSYNVALKALYDARFMLKKSSGSVVDKELKLDGMEFKLETMERDNKVEPDINTYNIKLGAYLRDFDAGKFDETLNKLSAKGLSPSLVTYNYRIKKLCKEKDCAQAKGVLDEMISKGMNPNLATFNTIIEGFCKVDNFKSAKEVFDSMSSNGVLPNSQTYATLIGYLVEHGEFDSALGLFRESMGKNYIPPFVIVESFVSGLVKNSKMDEAKEIVKKIKKRLKGSAVESWAKIESRLPKLV